MKQKEAILKIAPIWCQHCKALQKTNDTVVECLYNPLIHGQEHAFCASCLDAVKAIIKWQEGVEIWTIKIQ